MKSEVRKLSVVTTSILSALGGFVFAAVILGAKRIKGLTEAVKALSHDALFTRCEELLRRGSITSSELENLDILYKAYTDQGLNGAGTELYNRCKSLPLEQ